MTFGVEEAEPMFPFGRAWEDLNVPSSESEQPSLLAIDLSHPRSTIEALMLLTSAKVLLILAIWHRNEYPVLASLPPTPKRRQRRDASSMIT
jgi:hypothetical protein